MILFISKMAELEHNFDTLTFFCNSGVDEEIISVEVATR